ncbi:molybdenum cofactor guanylyltransferase [Curtobacterium sp. ISL-83]|uniref:molybdenum cofactor guanylyltransferase n=1 Tax=Curtobacterium sp. ISL-83 TaxID=2819145 RepID=UPI001BE8C26C|nr:NTP transferase domain-containing protein [Curtobacterium sp. ISL-83]MBT2502856.1 NTP transferase domain-containing protein [Curtobacterium sp. ISL-83]
MPDVPAPPAPDPVPHDPVQHDAILLAGGRATRLGGIDKTALVRRGTTLLGHALAAASAAERIVVVGARSHDELPVHVVRAREDPPFAGPVAALGAAFAALDTGATFTLVLACDLVTPEDATARLLTTAPATAAQETAAQTTAAQATAPRDGLIAVDDDGRRQPLLALYRSAALREAVQRLRDESGSLAGQSMRRLLAPLDLVEVPVPSALCADVDSAEDAARLLD